MKRKVYEAIKQWTIKSRRWGITEDELRDNFPEITGDISRAITELFDEGKISVFDTENRRFYYAKEAK